MRTINRVQMITVSSLLTDLFIKARSKKSNVFEIQNQLFVIEERMKTCVNSVGC